MFKEKQPLKYYYRVVKETGRFKTDEIVKIDERFKSKYDNDENFKFVATWQDAYIGDMQEQFDKVYERDNMKHFAESVRMIQPQTIYIDKNKCNPLEMSIFEFIKKKIKKQFTDFKERQWIEKTFKKVEEPDTDLNPDLTTILQDTSGKLFNNKK